MYSKNKSSVYSFIYLLLLAWFAGVLSFVSISSLISKNTVNGGDVPAILIWSAIGAIASTSLFYVPLFIILQKVLHGAGQKLSFLLVGIAASIVPACIAEILFGANPLDLSSSEFPLIFAFFAAIGVVISLPFGYDQNLII